MNTVSSSVTIGQQRTAEGALRLDVLADGKSVAHLVVVPLTIRVGVATVRVAGISDVWTEEAYRNQGHARRMLEAMLRHGRRSTAALSLLYGIDNFYGKFGYATAGPMYHLRITDMAERPPLPHGWRVRPLRRRDLPAIKRLYELNTADAVGAALRSSRSCVWSSLAAAANPTNNDECRIVTDENGQVVAYAWRGANLNYVRDFERYGPDTLVLAEVMAATPLAADAVLGVCCAWAAEEAVRRKKPLDWIYTGLPPWGAVATAAAYRENWLDTQSFRSGGFMARTLSTLRLLTALQPELQRRLHAARSTFRGTLRIRTEEGAALLVVDDADVTLSQGQPSADRAVEDVELPQSALARLALGAFPPRDVLARLPKPPGEQAEELLATLFPRRDVHLYLPDRP
jgi:hypothetical protein